MTTDGAESTLHFDSLLSLHRFLVNVLVLNQLKLLEQLPILKAKALSSVKFNQT
jgi:hypothetical protein